MKNLPQAPANANERVLAQEYRETQTGLTGVTLTLSHPPLLTVNRLGLELLFKNGALLVPGTDYTISGAVVSRTATVNVAVATFPKWSVAVTITVVVPIAKVAPLAVE